MTAPSTPPSTPSPSLHAWASALREHLGITDGTSIEAVLDLARDAASALERPAAPLTAFLVGISAGLEGGTSADVERAMAAARHLMSMWPQDEA
jgi:hypothetical protein